VDALRPVLLVAIPAAILAGLVFARTRDPARQPAAGRPPGRPFTTVPLDGRSRTRPARVVLLAIQVVLVVRFLVFVDGRLPLPGDHSPFLYRYHVLLHALPRLRAYDPWWNAGTADASAALSGAASTLALF
jgi:hypothetical protein